MELNRIENLLEKYFEAQTTIAEEQELAAYFNSGRVAQHLGQYKSMFVFFNNQAVQEFTKQLPLHKQSRPYARWLSVAAVIAVMFGLFTFLNREPMQHELGTYDDPEKAFRETQKALNMLSQKVNVGVNSVEYIDEYEKTKETIFKQ